MEMEEVSGRCYRNGGGLMEVVEVPWRYYGMGEVPWRYCGGIMEVF